MSLGCSRCKQFAPKMHSSTAAPPPQYPSPCVVASGVSRFRDYYYFDDQSIA